MVDYEWAMLWLTRLLVGVRAHSQAISSIFTSVLFTAESC